MIEFNPKNPNFYQEINIQKDEITNLKERVDIIEVAIGSTPTTDYINIVDANVAQMSTLPITTEHAFSNTQYRNCASELLTSDGIYYSSNFCGVIQNGQKYQQYAFFSEINNPNNVIEATREKSIFGGNYGIWNIDAKRSWVLDKFSQLPPGPQGVQGEQGEQGEQGIQGLKGDKGDTGSQGIQGIQGSQGPQGVKGDVGQQGPQGPQGEKGETGENGASFKIIGIVSNPNALPTASADFLGYGYMVGTVTPYNVYICIQNGTNYAWQNYGKIQGPQGPQGPQGIQGIQGNVGPRGPQGIQGLKGEIGDIGPQGPQGLKGDKGEQGIQGITGARGPQGVQGPQGPQGEIGPQGPQGVPGKTYTFENITVSNEYFSQSDPASNWTDVGYAYVRIPLITRNFSFKINSITPNYTEEQLEKIWINTLANPFGFSTITYFQEGVSFYANVYLFSFDTGSQGHEVIIPNTTTIEIAY